MEEICPVCAEKGITELREVRIEKVGDDTIKIYSPCGHKQRTVYVEDNISLRDSISVLDSIQRISGSLVNTSESIREGFNFLSGSFSAHQINIAKSINIENNLSTFGSDTRILGDDVRRLVELTEKQVEEAKKEANEQKKRFHISAVIAILGILVAILIAVFK